MTPILKTISLFKIFDYVNTHSNAYQLGTIFRFGNSPLRPIFVRVVGQMTIAMFPPIGAGRTCRSISYSFQDEVDSSGANFLQLGRQPFRRGWE